MEVGGEKERMGESRRIKEGRQEGERERKEGEE